MPKKYVILEPREKRTPEETNGTKPKRDRRDHNNGKLPKRVLFIAKGSRHSDRKKKRKGAATPSKRIAGGKKNGENGETQEKS